MDSSPPPVDPARPEALEQRLDSLADQVDAIDRLIGLARSRLCVFDRDLAEGGWDRPERTRALATFLRRMRGARASIIVHDTRYLESSCPRLLALLRVHGHALEIWRTGESARGANDALVIADGAHVLHRYHVEQPRATLSIAMPQVAQPLVQRFEEIWATGEPALGGSVLGL